MVIEAAKSVKDFSTHYDEVADKNQFHKDIPLSSYQKIVEESDKSDDNMDMSPTIQQSTFSLQA
jgi:hypothetical protein